MKKKLVKGFGILVIVAVILAVGIFVWLQISKSTKGDDSFRDNDFSFYIDKDMKGLVLNKYFGIQENLVIPNEVKKGEKTYPVVCIDAAVFASCETMKSVVISDNVLKIGAEAFSSCKNLKYVKVGKSVAHFGKYVFSNTPIVEIEMMGPPPILEKSASAYFPESLGAVWMPNEETKSAYKVHENWSAFSEKICAKEDNLKFKENEEKSAYSVSVKANTISTKNLCIPSFYKNLPVSIVSEGAFKDCNAILGRLTLGGNIKEIKKSAFSGCVGLSGKVNFSQTLEIIGEEAFYRCKNLSGKLTLPNSLKTIGALAFEGCTSFSGPLVLPARVSSVGNKAFADCRFSSIQLLNNATLPTLVGASNFLNNITLWVDNLVVLNACKADEKWGAFSGNIIAIDEFFSFTLNNDKATYCVGGKDKTSRARNMPIPGVYLGKNVTKIAVNGFSGYKNIEGPLILPENISEIEAGAFEGCRSIFGEIVIPAAVCKIGFSAFHGCDGISGFSVSKTNLNFSNDADGILYNHNKTELIQAFRDIQGYVKIAEGVKTICDKAFYQCTKLKGDLAFPESLESIGANSFRGAGYDGKLIIPFGMKKIGNEAFCDNYFNSIEFKCSPPDVGENVFGDYSGNIFVGDCNMISLYANCQSLTRYSPYFYAKQIKISVVYDGEKGYGNVYVNSSSQDDYASMAKVNNAEVATVKIDMIAKKGLFYAQYTPSYSSGVKSWSGATAPGTSNKENHAVSKYIEITPDFKSDIVVTVEFTLNCF